jgi:signal recognition particle receptor subunit beta
MASINYATREISCKIVYYGPGLSGKTTNLQIIHRKIPVEAKSEMVSLATETDRTLFFDFLPLDLGSIKGFATKFQLYTVPGQVYYNATRKLVLRGVDGVVFVADSQRDKMQENIDSLKNLQENLKEYGIDLGSVPFVLQYNKRDLPGVATIVEMDQHINWFKVPTFEAQAHQGIGVFTTLKAIGKIVIDTFNAKYTARQGSRRPSSIPDTQSTLPQTSSAGGSSVPARPAASPQQPFAPPPPQAPAPRPIPQAAPPLMPPPPPPPRPQPVAAPPAPPPLQPIPRPQPTVPQGAPQFTGFAPPPAPPPAPTPAIQGFFTSNAVPSQAPVAPTPGMIEPLTPPPMAAGHAAPLPGLTGFSSPVPPPAPASVSGSATGAVPHGSDTTSKKKSRLDGTLDPSDLDAEIARYEKELAEQKTAVQETGRIVTSPNVNPNVDPSDPMASPFLTPEELSRLQGSDSFPTRRMPLGPGQQ